MDDLCKQNQNNIMVRFSTGTYMYNECVKVGGKYVFYKNALKKE